MRVLINDLRLNVTTSGAGPALLLLHGFTGCGANWAAHAAVWAERFTVIAVDLLGHGDSDAPDDVELYSMAQCVADLIALCDALKVDDLRVVGYSMGGRVALHVAHAHPQRVRALVLESASPGLASAEERAARIASDSALADFIEREGLTAFVNRWENLPLFATHAHLSAEVRAALRAQRLNNNPWGLARSLRGLGTGAQASLWEALPHLHMPTLLIAGMQDEKFARLAQTMRTTLPHASLALITHAGHTPHLEQPALFQQAVWPFLLSTL